MSIELEKEQATETTTDNTPVVEEIKATEEEKPVVEETPEVIPVVEEPKKAEDPTTITVKVIKTASGKLVEVPESMKSKPVEPAKVEPKAETKVEETTEEDDDDDSEEVEGYEGDYLQPKISATPFLTEPNKTVKTPDLTIKASESLNKLMRIMKRHS
jgi:hypothetical protein